MDAQRPVVIVNPRSGGGLSEARWAKLVEGLTDGLGPFDTVFTTAPRDATAIAKREAEAGRRLVVAFGGDGTISETADGILQAGAGATCDLGVIPRGTGGDFRRSLELPQDLADAAARLREGRVQIIDAGRVTYVNHEGARESRHFVNVSSFGYSSAVARSANASTKRFGAKMAFVGAAVRTLASYDNTDVWLTFDDGPRHRRRVMLAAVGNGRFFGGGMKICPTARLDSGAFEVVVVGDLSRGDVLLKGARLFSGTHLSIEDVTSTSARKLVATPVEPDAIVPIELDGETPGRLPATFEVLPGALRIRV
ncbi:MAG TPA: diacylglycerol kinase family protein [Polyangia bacterium]|nr:diacylglycerol kinase family protein [Polyangia bacterium]